MAAQVPARRVTSDTAVEGSAWLEWDPSLAVEVAYALDPIEVFTLVDVTNGRSFHRPVGVHGTQDTWAK